MPIDDHDDTEARIMSQIPQTLRDRAQMLLTQYAHLSQAQQADTVAALALGLSLIKDLTPQSKAAVSDCFTQKDTPMTEARTTIRTKLNTVIEEHLGISDAARYGDDASMVDDLGCDSLDCAEIVMEVEEVWMIQISESEAGGVRTIGDLVSLIEKKTDAV